MSNINVLEEASWVLKEFSGAACPDELAEQKTNHMESAGLVIR
jgi:hypothetical protein